MKFSPCYLVTFFAVFALFVSFSSATGANLCPRQRDEFEHIIPYRDQCLQLMTGNDSKQWLYAREDCRMQGGRLLEITDSEMQTFVMSKLQEISHFDIWLGVSDMDMEGKWVWVSEHAAGKLGYLQVDDERNGPYMPGAAADGGHYSNWYPGQGPAQHDFLLADFMDCGLLKYHENGAWYNYPCASPIGFDFNYICQYV